MITQAPSWPVNEARDEIFVYVDDSGLGQPPISLLGGFAGTASQWRNYNDAWANELASSPKLKKFRLKEAVLKNGAFQRQERGSAEERLSRFVAIIEESQLVPVSIGTAPGHFSELAKILPKKAYRETIYSSLAVMLLIHLCDYVKDLGLCPKIDLVFDRQIREEAKLSRDIQAVSGDPSWKHGDIPSISISFQDDDTCLPLQAADSMVWSYRRKMASRILRNGSPNLPFDVDRLIDSKTKGAGFFALLSVEEVRKIQNSYLALQGANFRVLGKI